MDHEKSELQDPNASNQSSVQKRQEPSQTTRTTDLCAPTLRSSRTSCVSKTGLGGGTLRISPVDQLPTIIQSDLLQAQRAQIQVWVVRLSLDAQHLSWAGERRVLRRDSRGHEGAPGARTWRGFPLRSAAGGGRRDGEGLKRNEGRMGGGGRHGGGGGGMGVMKMRHALGGRTTMHRDLTGIIISYVGANHPVAGGGTEARRIVGDVVRLPFDSRKVGEALSETSSSLPV